VPAGTLMVSAPVPAAQASKAASVLAATTASRSEQSKSVVSSSALVLTVIVAACATPGPIASTATASVATPVASAERLGLRDGSSARSARSVGRRCVAIALARLEGLGSGRRDRVAMSLVAFTPNPLQGRP